MKIVEVVWDDAFVTTEESTVKKASSMKPVRTRTVGFLMAENDDGVVLATDTYENDDRNGRVINLIPWGMIVEWWEYR